jgi:hypothetical protein
MVSLFTIKKPSNQDTLASIGETHSRKSKINFEKKVPKEIQGIHDALFPPSDFAQNWVASPFRFPYKTDSIMLPLPRDVPFREPLPFSHPVYVRRLVWWVYYALSHVYMNAWMCESYIKNHMHNNMLFQ